MRLALSMLMCLGVCRIGLADSPPPPEATSPDPPAAAAPAATAPAGAEREPDRTPATSAAAAEAAAPPTAAPSAAPPHESAKPAAAVDPREKQLLAKGYRPEMHNGEKLYCKTEQAIGSRIATKRACGTIDALQSREQNDKDAAQSAQQHQLNPAGN